MKWSSLVSESKDMSRSRVWWPFSWPAMMRDFFPPVCILEKSYEVWCPNLFFFIWSELFEIEFDWGTSRYEFCAVWENRFYAYNSCEACLSTKYFYSPSLRFSGNTVWSMILETLAIEALLLMIVLLSSDSAGGVSELPPTSPPFA